MSDYSELAEQRQRALAELRSTIETAQRLTGLQRASEDGVDAVLDVLDDVLREHLGWFNSVLNLRTETGYTVSWDPRGILTGAEYSHADIEAFCHPRYARAGCWHIPQELSPTPGLTPAYDAPRLSRNDPVGLDDERAGDVLLVPLRHPDGRLLGLLSVDGAPGGKRPTDTTLELLATIADHAATALAAADRVDRLHQAQHAALSDPLTGLGNRTLLRDRVEHALAQMQRGATPPTLLYIDLDRFKPINDDHGHHIGDQVLITTGQRLRGRTRAEDTIARVGGDEFVILLHRAPDIDAVAAAIRMRLAKPHQLLDTQVQTTASIGVATALPSDDTDTFMQRADQAAYTAKRAGGNRVARDG